MIHIKTLERKEANALERYIQIKTETELYQINTRNIVSVRIGGFNFIDNLVNTKDPDAEIKVDIFVIGDNMPFISIPFDKEHKEDALKMYKILENGIWGEIAR